VNHIPNLSFSSFSFEAKDVEIVMLLLKTVGFGLRKDDPEKLKKLIVRIQQKSTDATHLEKDSRIKFMLEVLLAIKNNNVKKIPNYDPEHQLFLLKNMKQWLRPGASTNPFTIRMEDLLRAEERGRWWIVGSAWSGKADYSDPSEAPAAMLKTADFSTELLDLARKMRMNTDARKSIFCTVMSAEDYLDAFEKLVKLNVRAQKEREVAFVLLDCCLQEQRFNPYYAQLTAKLSSFDRKYRMAAQFAIWDKIKVLHDLKKFQRDNLSGFTCFLIREETLSIACLKVIEFADLDKIYVAFLKRVLTDLLAVDDAGSCKKIFSAVAGYSKLRTLREGLRLFMRHFMLKGKSDEGEREALEKRVELAEAAFMSSTERQLEL
jgi:nucleolar MIF4G domain-containing protein 1